MTETTTAIALPDKPQIVAAFADDAKLAEILSRIETEVRSEHLSTATPKERERIKSLAYTIARSKTTLDDVGKELVEAEKARIAIMDRRRKTARDRLDALKAEVRRPLDAWEKADEERRAAIKRKIAEMFNPRGLPTSSEALKSLMVSVSQITLDQFEEFTSEAAKAKDQFLQFLDGKIRDAEAFEATEAQRKLEADRQRAEAEAAKAEAAEARKREAEREAENARLRAELEAMKQSSLPVESIDKADVVRIEEFKEEAPAKTEPSVLRPNFPMIDVRESPQARREARAKIFAVLNQCHSINAMADEIVESIWNGEIPNVAPTISVKGVVS